MSPRRSGAAGAADRLGDTVDAGGQGGALDSHRLRSRWETLVPTGPAIGTELLSRYADPSRHYHDLDHLRAVLDTIDTLRDEASDARLVLLAAWYHDAVYDVHRDDNESRSAALAETSLSGAGLPEPDVAEVARLVRLTATHDPADGDANGAVLCDADLVVLAGDTEEYAAYLGAVRAEYAQFGEAEFTAGRTGVVEELLRLPALYRTVHGFAIWEERARSNLRTELAQLQARPGGT
jgi:predicted metal-dependent HD superfamily phosphohydrolase